jgi:uncharacterized protein (TIGR02452 family)
VTGGKKFSPNLVVFLNYLRHSIRMQQPYSKKIGIHMNKIDRIKAANDTLAILAIGHYCAQGETMVNIAEATAACVQQTRLVLPEELQQIAADITALPNQAANAGATFATRIDLRNETTLCGARRLASNGADTVGVLNFASARNPGGGFLGGAQAQEESLARSSALYLSQTSEAAKPFYGFHRAQRTLFYSDRAIFSPACPVFRDDEGHLLAEPYLVNFITSAAPNAGAIRRNEAHATEQIPAAYAQRIHLTLALALHAGCQRLVLGAWGCGVFANDPVMAATSFRAALGPGGAFENRFREVLFSVFDSTSEQATWKAFAAAFSV